MAIRGEGGTDDDGEGQAMKTSINQFDEIIEFIKRQQGILLTDISLERDTIETTTDEDEVRKFMPGNGFELSVTMRLIDEGKHPQ